MNTKTKKSTIGLRELRENMEAYIKRVNRGESITVFRRSTPLFRLSPFDTEELGWEPMVISQKLMKLGGFDNIYRVRSGDIRIIYRQNKQGVRLIEISHGNEKT